MYFLRGNLIVENYLTRRTLQGDSDTGELLRFFSTWKTTSQAERRFRDFTKESLYLSIRNFLKNGLLITKDSQKSLQPGGFGEEWLWPIASRYYHFSTKLDEKASTPGQIRQFYKEYLKGKRQPSIYKQYPQSRKVKLPSWDGAEAQLFGTLLGRRSTRTFTGEPITLEQLSRILFYTWGRVSTYKTQQFGRLLHKTSPSAGARHPIEAYAVVNNVQALSRGIYHYSVRDHTLELLRRGDFRKRCVALTAGHTWTRNSSVLFIMTAVVARTAWKYRIPRIYRALLIDAGHLSQTFLLVSTALGLGACCIGTFSDIAMEKELGLDGVNETVIFSVGVGHPAGHRNQPEGIESVN